MLSMESTSNRMSRLGKSLIGDSELLTFDRIIAEIDAVDEDAIAELSAALLGPEKLSAAGVGPDEDHFRAAVAHANASLVTRAAA
jgi:Predicted Zn-dependent peptidases